VRAVGANRPSWNEVITRSSTWQGTAAMPVLASFAVAHWAVDRWSGRHRLLGVAAAVSVAPPPRAAGAVGRLLGRRKDSAMPSAVKPMAHQKLWWKELTRPLRVPETIARVTSTPGCS
jgi:hypothetical protein